LRSSTVYLLGIITDRLADAFFGPRWAKGNRARAYREDGQSYAADKLLVLSEAQYGKLFEYNKSRQCPVSQGQGAGGIGAGKTDGSEQPGT
jgi:hypothetical protein